MPRNKNKSRNPILAAAVASTLTSAALRRARRNERKREPPSESKALVVYTGTRGQLTQRDRSVLRPSKGGAGVMASANSVLAVAPVQGGVISRGSDWSFGAAQPVFGLRGVRIHGRQIWCQVSSTATTGGSDTTCLLPYGVSASHYVLTFDPDDVKTMPPPIVTMALCFSRYALRRARIIYTPATGTSAASVVSFAAVTDCGWAQANDHPSPNNTWSPYLNSEHSNSVMGPSWQSMSLEVPCDGALRYIYQSVSDANLSTAEERQDHAFAIIAASSPATTTVVNYGYLHIEYELDLYEVVSGSQETALRRLEKRITDLRACPLAVSRAQLLERKEVKTPARDVEEKEPSSSPDDLPQASLTGGWSVVPALLRAAPSSVTVTPRGEQAGSVRSRSLKS